MPSYRNFGEDFRENSADDFHGNSATVTGMTTPLSRKKLLIFGGVFLTVILLVLILVLSLRGGSSSSSSGSDALKDGPTTAAVNSLLLKSDYKNKVSEYSDQIKTMLENLHVFKSPAGSLMARKRAGYDPVEALQVWSVGASNCTAASQKDAVSQTLEGIDAAIRMASAVEGLVVADTKDGLINAKLDGKVGLLIALGGGYTIDSRLAVLRMFYNLGARIITLTGTCATPWAGIAGSSNGLTAFGESVVKEASRLGIVPDLAGSSDAVITKVLDMAKNSTPAMFIGVGARDLTDNPKNIGNDTIKALAGNKDNLAMVSFQCDLIKNKTNGCSMDDVINHINAIASLSSRAQVGIAADFGYPGAIYPADLSNMAAVSNLFDKLHDEHNWSLDELRGLGYSNFLRLISTAAAVDSTKAKPIDDLEPETELTGNPPHNMTCYSDLSIRYGPDPSGTTAPPQTTVATSSASSPTTIATTTTKKP